MNNVWEEMNVRQLKESAGSGNMEIVKTDIPYPYEVLERDLMALKERYPFLDIGVAGQSVLGRHLYYFRLGRGPNEVFFNGAHHALEWITSVLLMKFCENFARAYATGQPLRGYDVRAIWDWSSVYVMPMVNPDGVDLVLNGLSKNHPYYGQLLEWNKGYPDFSQVWQANIRGVDLNHNYDASWELSKQAEPEYGITGPGPTRFSGSHPESEPEAKAVADFTRNHNFQLVMAYHSQGEVFYWDYQNLADARAKEILELFSKVSGYLPEEATGITSYAGYKDWFIAQYRRPGFTVEVGSGRNPLPLSQFPKIYEDNEELLLLASMGDRLVELASKFRVAD